MVHTVIYAHPFPVALPIKEGVAMCPAMLPRDGQVPWACTRERGHGGHHQAASWVGGKKLAEWSDE